MVQNLITFGEISPNDLKNAVNCLYTMYVNGDFSMITGGWMDYFSSKFNDFDQINIDRVTF